MKVRVSKFEWQPEFCEYQVTCGPCTFANVPTECVRAEDSSIRIESVDTKPHVDNCLRVYFRSPRNGRLCRGMAPTTALIAETPEERAFVERFHPAPEPEVFTCNYQEPTE